MRATSPSADYSSIRIPRRALPLTLALSPGGGEGIEMAPSPSERERVGVRVRVCSRIIRDRTLGGGLRPPSEPPPKNRWRRQSRHSNRDHVAQAFSPTGPQYTRFTGE